MTVGPDGAIWFTTYDSIGRMTMGGDVSYFTDSGIDDAMAITAGSDGVLGLRTTATGPLAG